MQRLPVETRPRAQAPSDRAPAPSPGLAPGYGAITPRAVALGLIGAVQVAVIQVSTKVRPTVVVPPWVSAPYLSWYAILPGAVFWLFLVSLLNAGLKRWRPRAVLRPAEFALLFGMTTVAAGIAAQDEVMQLQNNLSDAIAKKPPASAEGMNSPSIRGGMRRTGAQPSNGGRLKVPPLAGLHPSRTVARRPLSGCRPKSRSA